MVNSLQKTRLGKVPSGHVARDNITRLELLYEINKKAINNTRLPDMLEQVIMMTQRHLMPRQLRCFYSEIMTRSCILRLPRAR